MHRLQRAFQSSSRALLAGASIAGFVLLLSCGGGGGGGYSSMTPPPPPPPPPPSGTTIQVGQGGLLFSPTSLTVKTGTKVTFSWVAGGHSVVVGSNCTPGGPITLDTGVQGAGFSTDITMPNVAGDVPFYCAPHCGFGMTGVIHVTN